MASAHDQLEDAERLIAALQAENRELCAGLQTAAAALDVLLATLPEYPSGLKREARNHGRLALATCRQLVRDAT